MVTQLYTPHSSTKSKTRPSKQLNMKHAKHFSTGLDRDIAAMKVVWRMLREGSVRWIGEVGRKY